MLLTLLQNAGASPVPTQPVEDALWPIILASLIITLLCGLLHFEALQIMAKYLHHSTMSARRTILLTMVGLVILHLVEITIFACGYALLYTTFGESVGSLQGETNISPTDLLYFSFVVFTTVGFGDIVPVGPLRILAGVEALVGLMLITWSASFTFLIMQDKWRRLYSEQS